MDFISNFVKPVVPELKQFALALPVGTIGKEIEFFHPENNIDQIPPHSVILLSVPEDRNSYNNSGTGINTFIFRKEIYSLYTGNWYHKIFDFGELQIGITTNETNTILKEIIAYCIAKTYIPIIIGGSHALTYALYRAFDTLEQRVNLTVTDAQFDLNVSEPISLDSKSYLYHIIMDKPNNLNNFTNLGYQTFLNPQDEIQLLNTLLFDAYRLGALKKDIELCEPVLRETDVLSIDFSAIKSSDIMGNALSKISGFSSDEICQLVRYAGLSNKIKLLGIFEYNPTEHNEIVQAQLLAQMIWYFLEGLNYRKEEFPNTNLVGFKKYMVMVESEMLVFYKSDTTERWWMEINLKEDNKIKRHTLIPCTYNDYLTANRLEFPERWLMNRKKLEI